MKNEDMDSIMAEMHAIKDANSARFDHDLKRMFAHWGALQDKHRIVVPAIPKVRRKRTQKRGKSPVNKVKPLVSSS